MAFSIIDVDYSPLVVDYEFVITDEPALVKQVGELLIGNHVHIFRIINALTSRPPETPRQVIQTIIDKISSIEIDKRNGWLWQMISWLLLVYSHTGKRFHTQQPHAAPAHHGIDGLAILLTSRNAVDKIIICEDKFTDNPRNLIQRQVWPEFVLFENSEKDHVLVSTLSMILQHLDAGDVFRKIQNDIFNHSLRVYRVCINRLETHNDEEGRKRLFADYQVCVSGALPRRSGSTMFVEDHKEWMEAFCQKVIKYLKAKQKT